MDHTEPAVSTAPRQRIRQNQKAWKYIRDVTNTDLGNLNRIAIEDGVRKYTYGLMFREWERYASVFSALGMTAENRSRVGILGSTCAEGIFAFYGLNMVGADVSLVPSYSSLTPRKVVETIRSEKLTDFIVTDDFAQANLIQELLSRQSELALRNILVLHVPVTGVTVNGALSAVQEAKHLYMQGLFGPVCMDTLLAVYGDHPVNYASEASGDTAVILHTSGTTGGTGKPVALSDRAVNAAAACFYKYEGLELPWENLVTAVIVDLSNAYSLIDQVHLPFAVGATVVCAPGGILNPWFYKAIPAHGITFLFTVSAMFERWMKLPECGDMDFSSLRFVALGGASVSVADKRRYHDFLRRHGAGEVELLNGYGVSELGGACCLSSPDLDDEAIGYPLPGVSVRLLDEEKGVFLSEKDAPCEGVLYLNSTAIATTELDGEVILKTERVGRKLYICTNDLVRMDTDGKLTFLGRANRYFLHDEGKKYESGRVETEFSRQSGIESCAVAPVYVKTTHDNIPMLCVKTLAAGEAAGEAVQKALRQVFIVEKTLKPDNIPSRVMIARELPRNANGKIDLYRISRGEVEGDVYTVKPVYLLDTLADFKLLPCQEGPADMIKEVFDGLSAELKSDLSCHKNKNNKTDQEETETMNTKKAFEDFSAMNRMGQQMVKNLMAKATQSGKFSCSLPDMSKVKAETDKLRQKAKDAMPDVMGTVQKQAENVIPQMQQHMEKMADCMSRMNETALGIMQKNFDQNRQRMEQFFAAVQKQTAGDTAKEAPAEAAEEAPVEAAEEAPAEAAEEAPAEE